MDAAVRLFATRPFHEVKLDDVAAEAKVGKGTLYIYFKSKEDLHLSLLYEAFGQMVARIRAAQTDEGSACDWLRAVVEELVTFAYAHPHFWELMRHVGVPEGESTWDPKRREFFDLIEAVIRRGVRAGAFRDSHPELTARYIPSMVRAAMLYPPGRITAAVLSRHVMNQVVRGLTGGAEPSAGPT